MRYLRIVGLLGICLFCASFAHAQRVVVGVGVGPAYIGPVPVCAYGYYDYYPYACAPYGYYGPDWFVGGVFIGAGPWYHGYYGRPGFYRRGYYGRRYYGWPGFYGRPYYYGRPHFERHEREFEEHERFEHRGFEHDREFRGDFHEGRGHGGHR